MGLKYIYNAIEDKFDVTNDPGDYTQVIYDDNSHSAGRLWGGLITDDGSGKVNIAAGQGFIKKDSATLEDVPTSLNQGQGSRVELVSWDAISNFDLAGVGYNLIYWDASEAGFRVQLKENFYANFDFTTDFTIGRVYYDGTNITIRLCGMNRWNFPRRVQMFGEERFPVERATGLLIGTTGTRNITLTAGVLWAELVNRFSVNAFDSSSTDRFTYWYRNGSGGWTSVASQSQINNTQYDDGDGTLGTLTANRYGVHWVYVVHDSSVHVVYGQGDYTLTQAESSTAPSSIPGILGAYATLVGKLIIQKSSDTFTEVLSPFTTKFQGSAASVHNELSGLQGGTTNEYYHLTSAEKTVVENTSGTNTGDQVIENSIGINIVSDSLISTGLKDNYIILPYDCTIKSWRIIGNTSGNIVVDVWKANNSIPTVANSITGTEKPTLSSQQINSDTDLTTWTTNCLVDDVLAFNVDSVSGLKTVNLVLEVEKI